MLFSNRAPQIFWSGFLMETAGVAAILWDGLPIYRGLLSGQAGDPQMFLLAGTLAALIQACYWNNLRLRSALRFSRKVVLAHLILFLGRLNFTFVGGMFSVVFFVHFEELEVRLWKILLLILILILILILFSMFCYTMHLEWMGKVLLDAQPDVEKGTDTFHQGAHRHGSH